ncbi:tRNA (adenine-N1)-methyltransferase [Limisalsivibrio acetivorans]|uniref:tRNA (adenine-N1)-methyltransferase n=1 Tax=Limisalsivibrio acetivorans TaxID=1304888 RepID=UPI0003B4C6D8|nr:tRNA (adenine-N1)-methyltransferase [Limisalsivibrio acetivorans]
MSSLNYGDKVILVDEKKKSRHNTVLKEGIRFSTQYGFIEHEDILKAGDGGVVKASKGMKYRVYSPSYIDYVMGIKRRAQIIYPKDTAVMLMWGDIHPGLDILEAGIGQGALSIALLRALGGQGTLTSYEVRDDFAEQAQGFIRDYLGETPNHSVEVRSIYDGIDGQYDRIMLDLPEPWHVIPHSKEGLKVGGTLIVYLPTILQVKSCVDAMEESGLYDDIETFEFIKRPWKVEGRSVRPEMWTFNHSAFIISAKRVGSFTEPVNEVEEKPSETGADEEE